MSPHLVSVIMGIYNCHETLAEAIDSILSQTYPHWELIMCDDGSTDSTYQIAEQYCQNFPDKIVLLQNSQNLGLNKTLNRCLAVAKGEYIARMDGDDISLPNRFESQVSFLDSHPEYALVSTPMIYFDSTGEWGCGRAIETPQRTDFVFHAPCFCHAPSIIRREAFLAVNGYTEDPFYLRFEDCNLWYKLYAAGYCGANLPIPLYKMRDDRAAYKRRTVSTRLRACAVQYYGFRMLKLPLFYYPVLVRDFAKGLILSFLPSHLYMFLHKQKLSTFNKN